MQPGDVIDGKYRLVRPLGKGGMGEVFEAEHEVIGQRLAVKCLHAGQIENPEMVARFLREARAAAAIGSDHIVYVTDAGQAPDGTPYIVMEYLEGESLAAFLEREGQLPIGRTAALIIQVCQAVQAAHDAGIIHRDLKPENIFVTPRSDGAEWIKVLDFGIAKFRAAAGGLTALTRSGTTMGTPFYMAPEQLRESKNVDERADVYAVGVLLYQMISGQVPFHAESFGDLVIKVATTDPEPLRARRPDAPVELERIVLRAMARQVEDRYETIADLAAALEPFAAAPGLPVPATAVVPPSPAVVVAEARPPATPRMELPATAVSRAAGPETALPAAHAAPAPSAGPIEAEVMPASTRPAWLAPALVLGGFGALVAAIVIVWSLFGGSEAPGRSPTVGREPSHAEEPATAFIVCNFTTNVAGARLIIDGQDYDEIPEGGLFLDLPAGQHRVEARLGAEIVARELLVLEPGQGQVRVPLLAAEEPEVDAGSAATEGGDDGGAPASEAPPARAAVPRGDGSRPREPSTPPPATAGGARRPAEEALAEARQCVLRGDQVGCIRALEGAERTSRVVTVLLSCYDRAGRREAACALARRYSYRNARCRQYEEARCR